MNLEHVKTLCQSGEKKVVEYKTSTSNLPSAFETIFAFLNTKGGAVLMAAKDNGEIVGEHLSDMTRPDIATEID